MIPNETDKQVLESIARPRTILFIEDESYIREVFTAFAKHYDCVLDSVGNGYEGLELMRTKAYDTVFLDVRLPDIEGTELFRMALMVRPDADYVIISGFLTNDVIAEIQATGMAVFVVKPLGFRIGFLKKLFHILHIERLDPGVEPKISFISTT